MAKLNKINVEDIKTKAEKKDIYLYNDFLASTGYIDIKPDDIQRLQKWDLNEVFVEDTTSLDIEVSADFGDYFGGSLDFEQAQGSLFAGAHHCRCGDWSSRIESGVEGQ